MNLPEPTVEIMINRAQTIRPQQCAVQSARMRPRHLVRRLRPGDAWAVSFAGGRLKRFLFLRIITWRGSLRSWVLEIWYLRQGVLCRWAGRVVEGGRVALVVFGGIWWVGNRSWRLSSWCCWGFWTARSPVERTQEVDWLYKFI
jgi:hypothetical protein